MTLYRVELKQAAAAALASVSGVKNVFIDRSLPMTPGMLPAINLVCPRDNAVSAGRGQPQFTRVAHLYVHARLCHTSPANAEAEVEAFAEQIELAIMLDAALQAMITQVTELDTEVEVNSKTAEHTGEVSMHFGLEYIETYPPPGTPLAEITGTMTANGNAGFAGMQVATSQD